jgi:hypothetical protein
MTPKPSIHERPVNLDHAKLGDTVQRFVNIGWGIDISAPDDDICGGNVGWLHE